MATRSVPVAAARMGAAWDAAWLVYGDGKLRLTRRHRQWCRHERVDGIIVSTATVAAMFGVSRTRINELVRDGVIKPPPTPNKWPVIETVRAYTAHLKTTGNVRKATAKSAADARLRDAKAIEVELRNAKRTRELIHIDEAVAGLEAAVGLFRSELSGLPAPFTRDLRQRRAWNDTRMTVSAALLRSLVGRGRLFARASSALRNATMSTELLRQARHVVTSGGSTRDLSAGSGMPCPARGEAACASVRSRETRRRLSCVPPWRNDKPNWAARCDRRPRSRVP
jgi:hypothetical protein